MYNFTLTWTNLFEHFGNGHVKNDTSRIKWGSKLCWGDKLKNNVKLRVELFGMENIMMRTPQAKPFFVRCPLYSTNYDDQTE